MFEFYIDTADIEYIKKMWSKLNIDPSRLRGITTNPNAMHKVGCTTLKDWERILPELSELIYELKGDYHGELHVQAPNSGMTAVEVSAFAKHIDKFCPVSYVDMVLKIYPSFSTFDFNHNHGIATLNVTGLSDAATCISSLVCGAKYASIIPGRMEEVGINANDHLAYLSHATRYMDGNIITGSMRTIEGLKNAVKFNTIPTIGTRVWDLILEDPSVMEYEEPIPDDVPAFCPRIDDENHALSTAFFMQMNQFGATIHSDFKGL